MWDDVKFFENAKLAGYPCLMPQNILFAKFATHDKGIVVVPHPGSCSMPTYNRSKFSKPSKAKTSVSQLVSSSFIRVT
jgi:hypothetical protein